MLFDTENIVREPGPRHVLQLRSRVIDFPLTSGSLLNAAVGNMYLTLYRCTTHWQSIQMNDKTPQSCTNPLWLREQDKATSWLVSKGCWWQGWGGSTRENLCSQANDIYQKAARTETNKYVLNYRDIHIDRAWRQNNKNTSQHVVNRVISTAELYRDVHIPWG